MIRKLVVGVLAAVALVSCAERGESEAITPEAGEEAPPASDQGVPSGAGDAVPRETSGLLLVTGPDGEVTVMNPDGSGAREMRGPVQSGDPAVQPTWAPTAVDGRRRVAWTELADDGAFRIALGDAGGGETIRYPSPVAPFYYYWSPDATMLAFLGQNGFSLLQMGVLDHQGGRVEILGSGQPFYFDWRPDSLAIVTHVGRVLSMLTLAGDAWSSEGLPLKPGLFQAPAWLPEDRILILTPESSGSVQVGLSRAQTPQDEDPSPQRLVSTDLEGRSIRILAGLEGAARFEPDPTGRWVAFSDLSGELRVSDLTDGGDVAVSQGEVVAFEWSPVGERLLFMEVDREARALVPKVWDRRGIMVFPSFRPTGVLAVQYLPFWDQYSRSLTLWSPAGDAFTYPGVSSRGGENQIFVQHLDRSDPVVVAEGVFASWSPVSRGHLTGP